MAAFPVVRIVAGEPAVVVGRSAVRAFLGGGFFGAVKVSGPCEILQPGIDGILVYGAEPGVCRGRVLGMNSEQTEKTIIPFEVRIVAPNSADASWTAALNPAEVKAMYRRGLVRQGPREQRSAHSDRRSADDLKHCIPNVLTLWFRQGSGVRMRDGKLVVIPEVADDDVPTPEFAGVVAALDAAGGYVALRASMEPEAWLWRQKILNELHSGVEEMDKDLRFRIYLRSQDRSVLASVLNRVSAMPIVREAGTDCGASALPSAVALPTPDETKRNADGAVSPSGAPPQRSRVPSGGRPPSPPRPR